MVFLVVTSTVVLAVGGIVGLWLFVATSLAIQPRQWVALHPTRGALRVEWRMAREHVPDEKARLRWEMLLPVAYRIVSEVAHEYGETKTSTTLLEAMDGSSFAFVAPSGAERHAYWLGMTSDAVVEMTYEPSPTVDDLERIFGWIAEELCHALDQYVHGLSYPYWRAMNDAGQHFINVDVKAQIIAESRRRILAVLEAGS